MSEETKPENIQEKEAPQDIRVPCSFPGCTHKDGAETAWQVPLEDEQAKAQLPFCFYHSIIVQDNAFTCAKIGEGGKVEDFELHGPFDKVLLIERCIAAVRVAEQAAKQKSQQTEKMQ